MFVWGFGVLFLSCVCVGVGVLFAVGVCVCVCDERAPRHRAQEVGDAVEVDYGQDEAEGVAVYDMIAHAYHSSRDVLIFFILQGAIEGDPGVRTRSFLIDGGAYIAQSMVVQ